MWGVNVVLLLLANMLFPSNFVLGTWRAGMLTSAFAAGLLWAIIVFLTQPALNALGIKIGKGPMMMLVYLVSNFVALWLTARLAPLTGFGAGSFIWILGLAVVANVVQWVAWMVMTKAKIAEM